MKFLVQKKKTGMFLKSTGAWTKDSKKAKDFVSSIAAVNFCLTEKMEDVFIVLAFEEERLNLKLDPFAVVRVGKEKEARPGY
jgi:hypothetical protein